MGLAQRGRQVCEGRGPAGAATGPRNEEPGVGLRSHLLIHYEDPAEGNERSILWMRISQGPGPVHEGGSLGGGGAGQLTPCRTAIPQGPVPRSHPCRDSTASAPLFPA